MARDKERSVNPAQQQRKLEKNRQIKKNRAELQARRNEKLARRNPERIQRQIDDLKALESSGEIKPREKAILEDLERDFKAIRKAREALGEKAPQFGGAHRRREGGDGNNVLGKRRHDGERKHHFNSRRYSSGSDTDDSVRRIPMPEDTPPPIPHEHRRYFRGGEDKVDVERAPVSNRPEVPLVAKTTYESAPQVRDLRKEAVARFVPDIVRRKQEAVAGGPTGRLIEPEEMDRLEAEGYSRSIPVIQASAANGGDGDADEAKRLAQEEQRFMRELEMQDLEDDADAGREDSTRTNGQHDSKSAAEPVSADNTLLRRSRQVEMEEVEDEDA